MDNGRKKREDGKNARQVANRKYNEKAYDRLNVYVMKGEREKIKERAQTKGQTLNEYVNQLIAQDIADFQPIGINPYLKK